MTNKKVLFSFALEIEADNHFNDVDCIFTGVGKLNTTYALTKRIMQSKPDLIINLGSAGSNLFQKGSIVCCNQFIQRDMDTSSIGNLKYETPFSNEGTVLNYGTVIKHLPQGICGTGDNFEINHTETIYNVVDMEAYALAYISKKENIPFICLKYISDGADNTAAEDWQTTVHKAAMALREEVNSIDLSSY